MRRIGRLMVTVVFAVVAAPVVADDSVAMRITNASQPIDGEAPFPHGVSGAIACIAVTGGVVAHEAGARVHLPFVCRKRIDKMSPLLMKALITRDKVDVTLKFFVDNRQTGEQLLYTIELKDARLSDIRFTKSETAESDASAGTSGRVSGTSSVTPYEEVVTFTSFTKVTWTYKGGTPTCTDDAASTDPPQL